MMKKRTFMAMIITILVFSFGLVGCGNNEQSAQQKADSALELKYDEFEEMKEDNPAKAKNEFDGKTVKFHGYVGGIGADSIVVGEKYVLGDTLVSPFEVCLPTDVIADLNKGDEITVVGTFSYEGDLLLSKIKNAEIVE